MNDHPMNLEDEEIEIISKSQLKRESEAVQDIGKRLLELNAEKLKSIPLSDEILLAIAEDKRIKSHEAKRRHLQYIGKLVRKADPEAIEAALDLQTPGSEAYEIKQQQLERWRIKLLTDNAALSELFDLLPDLDRQQTRNLVRNATKEWSVAEKAGPHCKKLFALLKKHSSDLLG